MDTLISLYIFLLSSLLFICTFLPMLRLGFKENPFSSFNLYLYLYFLGFIIFILSYIGYKGQLPNYMQGLEIDKLYLSITFSLYVLSFTFVYVFLLLLKYKPINLFIVNRFKENIKNKYDKYLFASAILFILLISKFYGYPFEININKLVSFRYEMSHGYIVGILIFVFPTLFYLVLSLIHNKKNKYLVFFLIFSLFYFFNNARGPFVFSMLFALSFYSINMYKILHRITILKINKSFFYMLIVMGIVIGFYWWYSVNFRGQIAGPINLILQRLDNFLASYMVLLHNLEGLRLGFISYPFIYLIPRNLFPDKPFPPNGELSSLLFGANLLSDNPENVDAWSVNFGLVGEALFVGYGLFLIVESFLIALSLKIFSQFVYRSHLSYIEFILMVCLYTYPFSMVMGGALNPHSGQIFIVTIVYLVYKYIIKESKSI